MSILKFHSKNSLINDTFKLGLGTTISQAVIVLSAPVLSRIYPVELFGILQLFTTIVLTLSIVSGLRYEFAILLPSEHRDGLHLVILSLFFSLIVALISGVLFYIFREPVSALLNASQLSPYLRLTGFGIILFGGYNAVNFWNTRHNRYKLLAQGRIAYGGLMVLIQILFGLLYYPSPLGLILGLFIGKISEDCIHLFGIIQNDKDIFKKGISGSNLVAQMKKYKKFPKFSLWASLINTFSWQVPTLFLALFFNTTIVGFYMMGDRVIRMPINVIGRAIAQVFFQKGAEAHREGKIDLIFLQTVKMLSQIGFIPLLVLTFVGKELFIVLLGQKWAEAGVYVQIMAPWAFILFLASPLSNIINISEKQEKGLLFNVFILTSRIAALIIGGIADSPRLALAIFSFSGVLCYGWLLLWTGEVAQVPRQKTLRAVFSSDIRWSLSTVMILTILKFLPVSVWGMSFASALIVLLYFFLLWKRISAI